ncbi:MAG: hypothetical protein JXO22_17615 [Phycisphaerae bacterium]|nr:hypothetical protein [Phycisphaerae bacterium]
MYADSERQPKHALADAWLLMRCRARQLGNAVDQQLRETPFQTLAVLALLSLIWSALYLLLDNVLRLVGGWPLIGVVAKCQIFVNFFFVLAIMLAFSNAILAFGNLYGRDEAGQLITMPVQARNVILVKWLEGMLLSSWSFLLLGVPLMLAIAAQNRVAWYFYFLFTGHFVGFVVIPATAGVVLAWFVATFAPRRPLVLALWIGCGAVAVVVAWFWRISLSSGEADAWLRRMLEDLSFTRSIMLPSTWTAEGITCAIQGRVADSLFYLLVVAGNAVFLVWLTVNIIGATWSRTYSRAQHGRLQTTIRRGWVTEVLCRVLFGYLPRQLQLIMLKDVRNFARDATQWTQMAIMLGLLLLYAANLHRLPINAGSSSMQALVSFLNLTTVSLILATFTSRFVFPLLSLESQQLWLLSLLPIRRVTMLFVKFLFALTVTGASSLVVMGVAVFMLGLPLVWVQVNILLCFGVCVGLCGLSVGLGARFPVLGQRNPARIAAGIGGSINLIASMVFVAIVMLGMGVLTLREVRAAMGPGMPPVISPEGWRLYGMILGLCVAVAASALWIGARRFARLEF